MEWLGNDGSPIYVVLANPQILPKTIQKDLEEALEETGYNFEIFEEKVIEMGYDIFPIFGEVSIRTRKNGSDT